MKITSKKTRVFVENENLVDFILEFISQPQEGAILAVTSKVVALSEGRTAPLQDQERVIKVESEFAIKTEYVWLTIKDGTVMANAGIDASNAAGKLVLLPKDSFAAAQQARLALKKAWSLKKFGIVITDSRVAPLRAGVVGVALGYAGFKGLRDYRGTPDIFGRPLQFTRTDVADAIATAAVLEMGEGSEQQPLALIEEAPVEFAEEVERNELRINPKDDLYRPLFQQLPKTD